MLQWAKKRVMFQGAVTFDLDQSIEYRFTLSRVGYDTRTFDLTPITATYTIQLTPESDVDYSTVFDKVSFVTLPEVDFLRGSLFTNYTLIRKKYQ